MHQKHSGLFAILTATRTSEAIEARWDEIDLVDQSWMIPADRMKAGRIHRVPLSAAALAVLKKLVGLTPFLCSLAISMGSPFQAWRSS